MVKKTPFYFAVEIAHKRIDYGTILQTQPNLLKLLKTAIFHASEEVLKEAQREWGEK